MIIIIYVKDVKINKISVYYRSTDYKLDRLSRGHVWEF